MKQPYLEVTFHLGRPFAAYYYLPGEGGDVSARTQSIEPGMVIDFAPNGRPIGIEISGPSKLTLNDFNRVLNEVGMPRVTSGDLAPLCKA
ncbi:MAG: hypothetical protein ACI8QC_000353 [Planctomycetota bacterium]|jgi:hypothetical protein